MVVLRLGIKKLGIYGDSSVVINQMKGVFQCKTRNLPELRGIAKKCEAEFVEVNYNLIQREVNQTADHLSKRGLTLYKKGKTEEKTEKNEQEPKETSSL